ncbi:hypothetical protein OEZ85_009699 [Tetradesmus obliquus]|uniref:Fe2OG dioxygenase domain-containing protein n=1 Tax=Tetradesmus obliquus TaxID=3088 RepID=A0ABY8UAU9_TETOB|nr:hypothetical protein OEZ85_009699 [Tetradesmus obliquus]
MQLVVQDMRRGRGYEISPEHKQYMQAFQQQQQQQQQQQLAALCGSSREPSALAGILSERFMCGPPLTQQQLQQPYYCSELGQVFFTPDVFPSSSTPELQPAMQACYSQCEIIAGAVLRLAAASLGLQQHFFDDKICRHHSNLQVANYPSQLLQPGPHDLRKKAHIESGNLTLLASQDHNCTAPYTSAGCSQGPHDLRKKAHIDSGSLTLLASQDYLPGSGWRAGNGGLQLLSASGQWLEVQVAPGQWLEVEVPAGALLLNLGSLMSRWTNGLWKATLHRVTNPLPAKARSSRRLSMAFFHKPNYDAIIEVLPTCYQSSEQQQQQGLGAAPVAPQLPASPLFPPAVVGDLTRQGVLHKLQHLPPEEASRRYHELMAATRSGGL